MDSFSFTLNKIAGAVLGTCLVGMGIGIVADAIYSPSTPKKPGYALPEPKEEGAGGKKETGPTLPALLAKADPKKGEQAAQVCGACHNFQEGAGAKVGPDLYGVVDREKGSAPGFDYSAGMKKKGGKWTFADLDTFITKPSAYVQGTKMGFAGEENPEKRANIIVYLRTLSKSPVPLPKVEEPAKDSAKTAEAGGKKEGAEKGGGDQFAALVAESDPKKGESAAGVCGACHNFKKGEGAKIGPDLYGVVDRQKGSEQGFDYSSGMKKKGGKWTYDDLNQFLTKPSAYVPGTKMGFAGEANEKKRASIVAYLRTLADKPEPLPGGQTGQKAEQRADQTSAQQKAGQNDEKKAVESSEKKPDQNAGDKPKQDETKKAEQRADQMAAEQKAGRKDEKKAVESSEKKPDQDAEKAPKPDETKKAESGAATGGGNIVELVAKADPKQGESAAQICSACHHFKKGEGKLIGPDLYGVVDRDKGSEPGFDYSQAMKAKGGKWTFADLNQFLTNPQAYVPGTKMGYPGDPSEQKRAEIIAFLRTLSDNPVPLSGGEAKK